MMKKNMKKLLCGFTIAELLITMLISVVIGAALVPVIGTKKIKNPFQKAVHGYIACYYDENNELQCDSSNDSKLRNGSFYQLPGEAKNIQIITVGPGGMGFVGEEDAVETGFEDEYFNQAYGIKTDGEGGTGSIVRSGTVDLTGNLSKYKNQIDSYQVSGNNNDLRNAIGILIGKAPSVLQKPGLFDFDFTIKSPIGAGGRAACSSVENYDKWDTDDCRLCHSSLDALTDCPDSCFKRAELGGGSSAPQYKISSSFGLTSDFYYVYSPDNNRTNLDLYSINNNSARSKILDYADGGTSGNYVRILLDASKAGEGAQCSDGECSPLINSQMNNDASVKCKIGDKNCLANGEYIAIYEELANRNSGKSVSGTVTYNLTNCYISDPNPPKASSADSYTIKNSSNYFQNGGGFRWVEKNFTVNGKAIPAGASGGEITQIYQKLEGDLRLEPANRPFDDSGDVNGEPNLRSAIYIRKPGENNWTLLQQSRDIKLDDLRPQVDKYGNYTTKSYDKLSVSETEMPVIAGLKAAALPVNDKISYLSKLKASGSNSKLYKSCRPNSEDEEQIGYCPGYAGFGVYPIVSSLSGYSGLDVWVQKDGKIAPPYDDTEAQTRNIEGASADDLHQLGESTVLYNFFVDADDSEVFNCGDDRFRVTETVSYNKWNENPDYPDIPVTQKFCYPTAAEQSVSNAHGTGGAIIIVW